MHVEHRFVALVDDVDNRLEVVAFEAHVPEHVCELILLVLPVVPEVDPLEGDFGIEHLILRLGGEELTDAHGDHAGKGARDSGEEDLGGVEPTADDCRYEEERRDEPVVDTEDDVPHVLARIADVRLVVGWGIGSLLEICHR